MSENEGNQCILSASSDVEVTSANMSAIDELSPVKIGSAICQSISIPRVRLNVAPAERSECVASFACAVTDQASSALILTVHGVFPRKPL